MKYENTFNQFLTEAKSDVRDEVKNIISDEFAVKVNYKDSDIIEIDSKSLDKDDKDRLNKLIKELSKANKTILIKVK